jgi:protein-S-isoprenylcysteine O-methyltransferase Ste14
MVALVSWLIFRTLAPRSVKEWRNAGLLQAFVIALYAEMYGFPLTVYFLTSIFGLHIPWLHSKGHLWATLLGYDELGALLEMLVGYVLVFSGVCLLFLGWKQVYAAQKEDRLVTTGLYGGLRHPQYTGIFLALLGQLIHWPTIITLLLFPVIVAAYYRLAKKEERTLAERFGADFEDYRKRVPMFFPRWSTVRALVGQSG